MPDSPPTIARPDPPHTVVLSDLHVTDAQEVLPEKPLWKRYKQRDLFIDATLSRFVDHLLDRLPPGSELVLAGDVFDFDSVMAVPERPSFRVSWLERRRGLDAEEPKSCFKMARILADHPVFVAALRRWVLAGNVLVFVVGNHDIELHWPSVRTILVDALALPPERAGDLRVCEWFYLSNGDTLVEHGNQYDSYCLCADPIHPTVRWRGEERMRVPFGNLAERYMLNAMGLFNPHVDSSFIMTGLEYVRFFLKYVARIQPLLGWAWLWGALVTLVMSVREGFLPSVRHPLRVEQRVAGIARRANTTPGIVRGLEAIHVHPAIFNPWKIMRELWLDRAVILALLVYGSFQVVTVLNVFAPISPWWAGALFGLLLPPFAFYARSVRSDVNTTEKALRERLPVAMQLTGAMRMVVGHTHIEHHTRLSDCELINTGTWSPAFKDVECTIPHGRKCFAWIRPVEGSAVRRAGLYAWRDPGFEELPPRTGGPPLSAWERATSKASEAIRSIRAS